MNSKSFTSFVAAALAVPVTLLGANSSTIRSPLINSGVDADASGSILSVLQAKQSLFSVELAKLAPKTLYRLEVGGVREAEFTTDSKGRARLRFSTKAEKEKPLLDFDPRGKTVAVKDASDPGITVLEAKVSGEGEPVGAVVDERADLVPGDGVKGKGSARYVSQKNGRRSFEVTLSGVTATGLHLFVDGIDRGEIASRGRSARVQFSSAAREGQPLLDFDPRDAQIDIKGLGDEDPVIFSGKLAAKANGVNVATRNTKRALIPSTNLDPDGQAEAKLRTNADASKDFSVELEDVPEGEYTLFVNDEPQGTIVVSARPEGGTKGEIEFTSEEDDDNGELLLTFNPVGATLTIAQGTAVYFTGAFEPGSGTNDPAPAPGTTVSISEALASTGLDANAKGEAEFSAQPNGEKEFEVEIEDVLAGKYQLFVGGKLRGTITAQAGNNGQVKGKIKFEAAGTGEDRLRKALRGGKDDPAGDDRGGSGGGGGKDDPAGDDRGGSGGGGADDPAGDDRGGSGGGGADDPAGDDRGGSGGGGADDPAGDDRGGSGGGGADDPAGDDRGGSGGGGADDPAGDDRGGSGGGGSDDANVTRERLDFDPRGQLIEVKNAAGTYFSHLFGDGSAPVPGGDGTGAAVPGKISVALISSGQDSDATAEAEFKRDEKGRESFEVELEDLPAGSYELLVGGETHGSITVVVTDRGTRGKVEFDDEPVGDEQPLTFDPLGQVITVQQEGTVYFQRTFPSGS